LNGGLWISTEIFLQVRKFRPNFIDTGDGTKKMDPMLGKLNKHFIFW
jgi:hypothetical protein